MTKLHIFPDIFLTMYNERGCRYHQGTSEADQTELALFQSYVGTQFDSRGQRYQTEAFIELPDTWLTQLQFKIISDTVLLRHFISVHIFTRGISFIILCKGNIANFKRNIQITHRNCYFLRLSENGITSEICILNPISDIDSTREQVSLPSLDWSMCVYIFWSDPPPPPPLWPQLPSALIISPPPLRHCDSPTRTIQHYNN
jgi:hypothetical protein